VRTSDVLAGQHGAFSRVKLAVLLIILLGLIAYSNSLRNRFVWDDVSSVQFNKHITSPSYIPEIFKSEFHHFARSQGNFYRPLLTLSFMLDYKLWGEAATGAKTANQLVADGAAGGFHFTNMVMHIGVALLVFFLVRSVFGKETLALAVSLLFVAHPIHTQAVTYVSGRGDMLTNLFLLSSFLMYWRVSGADAESDSRQHRAQDAVCVAGAIVCYIAALLSKESAIILPFLVLACALVFRERRNRKTLVIIIGLFICMVVYAVLRETSLKFGVSTTDPLPFGERLLKGAQAFATYVRLLFVPVGLHMERGVEEVAPLAVIFTIACFAGACLFVWKRWRENPAIAFALLWFLIAWLPVSGIYPLNAAIAEHWLYLPSIGFIALVVGSLDQFLTSERIRLSQRQLRRLSVGALAIILLCFTGLTIRRNTDWHDNISLFTSTLEYAPNSSRVHYNLAVAYQGQDENDKALKEFLETVRLDPGNAYVWLDLAAIYAGKRQMREAAQSYMEAISRKPNDPEITEAYINLGKMYYDVGQREQAVQLWQKALELRPDLTFVRQWLAQAANLQPQPQSQDGAGGGN
jgi:hypothetical protein